MSKYQKALNDICRFITQWADCSKEKETLQELIDKTTFTCSCGNTVIIGQDECNECKLLFAWDEIERDGECDE